MSITAYACTGKFIIVNADGLFLTHTLTWTSALTGECLYTSWLEAHSTLLRYQNS